MRERSPTATFGRPGLLARTDYLVEGKHRLTAFVAAEKEGGDEGQDGRQVIAHEIPGVLQRIREPVAVGGTPHDLVEIAQVKRMGEESSV